MAASQWEAVMMAAATQWLPGNGSEAMVARKSMHLKGNGVKVKLVSAGQAMQLDNQTAAYAIGRPAPAMQSDGQPGYAIGWPAPAMQLEGRPRLCNWMASPGYAIGWPAQAMQSVATTRVMQSDPAVRRCTARAIPGQVMIYGLDRATEDGLRARLCNRRQGPRLCDRRQGPHRCNRGQRPRRW